MRGKRLLIVSVLVVVLTGPIAYLVWSARCLIPVYPPRSAGVPCVFQPGVWLINTLGTVDEFNFMTLVVVPWLALLLATPLVLWVLIGLLWGAFERTRSLYWGAAVAAVTYAALLVGLNWR